MGFTLQSGYARPAKSASRVKKRVGGKFGKTYQNAPDKSRSAQYLRREKAPTATEPASEVFRWSTKLYHEPSGLVAYEYRFYDPSLGRWLNRDPIEENGGKNLYLFTSNNPVTKIDIYGLVDSNSNDRISELRREIKILREKIRDFPSSRRLHATILNVRERELKRLLEEERKKKEDIVKCEPVFAPFEIEEIVYRRWVETTHGHSKTPTAERIKIVLSFAGSHYVGGTNYVGELVGLLILPDHRNIYREEGFVIRMQRYKCYKCDKFRGKVNIRYEDREISREPFPARSSKYIRLVPNIINGVEYPVYGPDTT